MSVTDDARMKTARRTPLMRALGVVALVTFMSAPVAATGQSRFESSAGPLKAETLVDGLSYPWSVAFLPAGGYLVTERPGALRIVRNGKISEPVAGVPDVWANGQGGLLDVVLAPDFENSRRLYLSYSKPGDGGAGTAVMAATLIEDAEGARLTGQQDIFEMNRFTSRGQHFGSRIVVADDGNLFVTLGERGQGERAQDIEDLAGAVVRIAPDGSIPQDNPFVGEAGHDALWSIGHRNPQGAAKRPSDGSLWTVEHGAQGGDEINKPHPGANYGWPVIAYGENYGGGQIGEGNAKPGMEQPVYYWDPSIAPSGLAFYDGEMFPEWQGDLLVGALKFQLLSRLDMQGDEVAGEEQLFKGAFGRIRDVRVGPDGAIYLLTDKADGELIRISRANDA
ncbi:PQQ-dependent sugar dehydrogenase [Cucumibacter marinus]|uniref:PQQ-dependent sugar dehydrogenase n=1 Tax=Cucumibacter marinus TaxID=1121252 RepID=UPI001FE1700D|nr:PQQ-dependent sugar dehydrogenase [Cucumibacter marinus]